MGPLIYNFVTLRRAQQWARGVLRETLHCHALLGLMEPRLIDNALRSFLFFSTYPSSDPSSSQILLYSSLFPYIQLYILITLSLSVSIQRIGKVENKLSEKNFAREWSLTVSLGGLQHWGELRPLWLPPVAEFETEWWRFCGAMLRGVTESSSVVSMSTSSSELSSLWDAGVCSEGCSWATGSTIGGPRITGRKADWCNDGFTVGMSGSVGLEPLIGGGRGPEQRGKNGRYANWRV